MDAQADTLSEANEANDLQSVPHNPAMGVRIEAAIHLKIGVPHVSLPDSSVPVLRDRASPFTCGAGAEPFSVAVAHAVSLHTDAIERHTHADPNGHSESDRNAQPKRKPDSYNVAHAFAGNRIVFFHGNPIANRNAYSAALILCAAPLQAASVYNREP